MFFVVTASLNAVATAVFPVEGLLSLRKVMVVLFYFPRRAVVQFVQPD
jgi:hypothetical protein